jgi:predicted nuclease of predicted toxin-antitoxin system
VKLLFDQNLSFRLVDSLDDLFPGSCHVRSLGLDRSDDAAVWEYAKGNGFVLISKDSDFHQRSLVHGHPPKFIWIRAGNCSTAQIAELVRTRFAMVQGLEADPEAAFLILSPGRR